MSVHPGKSIASGASITPRQVCDSEYRQMFVDAIRESFLMAVFASAAVVGVVWLIAVAIV